MHTYFYSASLNSIQMFRKTVKPTSTHLSLSFKELAQDQSVSHQPLSPTTPSKEHEMPGHNVLLSVMRCVCLCRFVCHKESIPFL